MTPAYCASWKRSHQKVLVVVDEAYSEYVEESGYPDCSQWLQRFPNLVVTHTFSKAYGLAGLRIGYSLSHPQVAELLNRLRQPFNVNNLAQVAALAALSDSEHLKKTLEVNRAGKQQLEAGPARPRIELDPIHRQFFDGGFQKTGDGHFPSPAAGRHHRTTGTKLRPAQSSAHQYQLTGSERASA